MLEVILTRTQVRVISDRKMIPKKKLLKEAIKLVAPLFPILGITVVIIYLPYNNAFMGFLGSWLSALDLNLIAIYYLYLYKDDLRSPITMKRLDAIKKVKLATTIAHIFTAIDIFAGGLLLALYLIYLRAVASGLTKVSASITSQEAIQILLLLILLLLPAYVVKRETKKAIRLGMENVASV